MISTLPPVKGISPYTQELCTELAKHVKIDFIGFKQIYPEFLYPGGTRIPGAKAPRIKNLTNRSFLTWYNPFTWIWAGMTSKGDVVHAQWWAWPLAPMYCTILAIAKLRGKKIVMTVHNVRMHETHILARAANWLVIRVADSYIVHSAANKTAFSEDTGISSNVAVVPLGIEPLRLLPRRVDYRAKYGISSSDKVLLFYGNIRDYKGLDVLIKSLKKLPEYKLLVAGQCWGGFDSYRDLANRYKVNERIITHLGYQSNKKMAELIHLADVAVFPYKFFDAASAAATTALQHRKAIVVTNLGSMSELVSDSNAIAKPNSAKDLARAILYAYSNKQKLENESGELSASLQWSIIAPRVVEVYNA